MRRLTTMPPVALAALLLTSCAGLPTSIEAPQVSLAEVTLDEATLMQQRYTLKLRVENPNPVTVPIRSIAYDVRLAGADFASGATPSAFSVAAKDATLIEVGVTTDLLQTARQLMTFLSGRPDSIDYALSGEVAVDLPFIDPIPFTKSGQVAFSDLARR